MSTLPSKLFIPIDKSSIVNGNSTDLYRVLTDVISKLSKSYDDIHAAITSGNQVVAYYANEANIANSSNDTPANLDEVDDGTLYVRVDANCLSNHIVTLANCSGNLDDISNGANWGKVALTSISAGKIIVAGLDANVTARMFSNGTTQAIIEGWRHSSDLTLIDGGDIYANSISAAKINGGAFGNLEISSGQIKLSTANALNVNSANGIVIAPGGDIMLTSDVNDSAMIRWRYDANHYAKMTVNSKGNYSYLANSDGSTRNLDIGETISLGFHRLFGVNSAGYANLSMSSSGTYPNQTITSSLGTYINSGNYAYVFVSSNTVNPKIDLSFNVGGNTSSHTFNVGYLSPSVDHGLNLGYGGSYAIDQIYCANVQQGLDLLHMDSVDDLALIHKIKGSGVIDEASGFELIDDNTVDITLKSRYVKDIPNHNRKSIADDTIKYKKGDLIVDSAGKPYISLAVLGSLLIGAVRALDKKYETHLITYHGELANEVIK